MIVRKLFACINPSKMLVFIVQIFFKIRGKNLLNLEDDRFYITLLYKIVFKHKLNLRSPATFNEKIQWIKLYDRNPLYTELTDKYTARKYIAEKIGEKRLVPLLGVWDKFADIDFAGLPNQFVLKCNHDCGSVVICNDKGSFDIKTAKKKLTKALKKNHYYAWREWQYKDIKPRIIAEKYLCDSAGNPPLDYKVYCFNGQAMYTLVCAERKFECKTAAKYYFFDNDWNLAPLSLDGKNVDENFSLPKPAPFDEMILCAGILSEPFNFVRTDFYIVNNKLYFGEMTFTPAGGYDRRQLPETDLLFGKMLNLQGK